MRTVKFHKNNFLIVSMVLLGLMLTIGVCESIAQCQFTAAHTNSNDQCLYATEEVVWSKTGLSATLTRNGFNLDKTSGTSAWNAGAISVNSVKNNGWVTNTVNGITTTAWAFGLSSADGGVTNSTIQYSFQSRSDGSIDIIESGGASKKNFAAADGKVVKIAIENSVVKYYYDGNLVYVSTVSPAATLYVDVSLNTVGAGLRSVQVTNGSDGAFSVSGPAADLGASPTYKWYLGATFTGVTSSTYTNTSLTTGNQIYCEVTPGAGGCSASAVNSNKISFQVQSPSIFGDYYISNTAASPACWSATEQVLKFNKTNVSVVGNNLTKNYGVSSGAWDAGASSSVKVYDNGYAETTIAETNKTRAFGLSNSDPDLNVNSIKYGFSFRGDGLFDIYESGTRPLTDQGYSANDVFKVAIVNGVINYLRNNMVIYISNTAPSPPLLVDISFQDMDGTINNVNIFNGSSGSFTANASITGASPSYQWYVGGTLSGSGSNFSATTLSAGSQVTCAIDPGLTGCAFTSSPINIATKNYGGTFYVANAPVAVSCLGIEEQVQFSNTTGVTTTGNSVTKVQGGTGFWNAGATSLNQVGDNGYVSATVPSTSTTLIFGLTQSTLAISHAANADKYFQYSIQLSNGLVYVFEYNATWGLTYWNSFPSVSYSANDAFKISVENGTVRYYHGLTNFYTSSTAATSFLPMVVNTAISTNNATWNNVVIGNGSKGVFTATATAAGAAPTYTWFVGSTQKQSGTLASFSTTDLHLNDVVTCKITPDIAGCNSLSSQTSNAITLSIVGGSSSPSTTWTGLSSTAWELASNWSNGPPNGYTTVVIPSTTNKPVLSSTAGVYDITIQSGATLKINGSNNLIVYDAWNNQGNAGALTAVTSKVSFKNCTTNSNSINVSDPGGNTFYDVELDNVYGATISGNHTMSNNLKLSNGIVYSASSPTPAGMIVISDNATISNASANNFIASKIKKVGNDAFTFPIGKKLSSIAHYRPLLISAPASVTDEFTAEYFYTAPSGGPTTWPANVLTISGCEYWNLDRKNGSTSTPSVTLNWVSSECDQTNGAYVADASQLVILGFDGSNWQNWGNTSTGGSASTGSITSNMVTAYGPFALATLGATNVLPIELVRFETQKNEQGVNLVWTTASEVNSSFFEIERSTSGKVFSSVTKVLAAGNSNRTLDYNYVDHKPAKGKNYYRLKLVDNDGSTKHSEVRYVDFDKEIELTAFPNPVRRGEVLEVTSSGTRFTLVDPVSGKIIKAYENVSIIDTSSLAPGLYLLVDEFALKFRIVVL